LFDGLGSIVGLTDSNGTLVSTYQYDPYGNLTSSTGSVANPWRFAGGYFDSSTGLYKYGTRYYDSAIGRWSQQDPVRGHLDDPTSLNRYLYAGDDPVNFTDPSGRDATACVYAFIVALVGLLATLFTMIGLNVQEGITGAALFAALGDATADAATIAVAEATLAGIVGAFWWLVAGPAVIALAGLIGFYIYCLRNP
jgi:RHS repeat-associated protein